MAAMVLFRGDVYYQMGYRAAFCGQYDTSENYTTKQTENINLLSAACSECNFTVYCGWSDSIEGYVIRDLKISST